MTSLTSGTDEKQTINCWGLTNFEPWTETGTNKTYIQMKKDPAWFWFFFTDHFNGRRAVVKRRPETIKTTETITVRMCPPTRTTRKGLTWFPKQDCLTCHKIDEKLTGPAYGMWPTSMPVCRIQSLHILRVRSSKAAPVYGEKWWWRRMHLGSQADAEAMVKYILLLKKIQLKTTIALLAGTVLLSCNNSGKSNGEG